MPVVAKPRRSSRQVGAANLENTTSLGEGETSSLTHLTQTVDRALAVLACFSVEQPELSLTEIALRFGLHVSTAHRLLATMEARGYVERDARSGSYRLGLSILELAGVALNQSEVCRHGLSELDFLRDTLNLSANLAVLRDGDVLHLAYSVPTDVPRYNTTIGRRAVAHCTALGKVLLAALPREAVHADIERRGWRPYTIHGIQDAESLDRCLDDVLQRGYALDREERDLDLWCVASPVRNYTNQVVAAISVSGPPARFAGGALDHTIATVRERGRHLSMKLGYVAR